MKNINTILIICLLYSIHIQGQDICTLIDYNVLASKGLIEANLFTEATFKSRNGDLLKKLEHEEYRYEQKRGLKSSLYGLNLAMPLRVMMKFSTTKINKIGKNIKIQKMLSLGLRHGLSRHASNLQKEKENLYKLKEDFKTVLVYAPLSGGAGYGYTAYLKLMIRAVKIRAKILEIDKQVKSLSVASKIFYSK